MKKVKIFPPGGDMIGRRRLDTHFYGLRKLGASIEYNTHHFIFEHNGLQGKHLFLDEASVTATEQIIIASTYSTGKT